MLTIVPTPIGNLEDMPPRALRALKEAATVYCEDTRRTRALMSHFGLSTPLSRYHEHDPRSAEQLLGRLRTGAHCALVSDGGLPGVSDPGRRVVAMARKEGLPVSALPGPCAAVTALAGSGLPADSFVFLGFLPRSAGRQKKILEEAAVLRRTIAIYESPFRVVELLENAQAVLGAKAQACVARELSKMHEEWLSGTLDSVRERLAAREELLGEFVVMLHPDEEPAHAG
ncbi:MAG: 16S rRNA (cytidine(1402)-2'-O)-methyltransferase [Elusimicrobia bacterium]|nr:16S rRNA (cytidine(1402)-2'-O)-methyltransferase [Elusimicrobiota bacterium]